MSKEKKANSWSQRFEKIGDSFAVFGAKVGRNKLLSAMRDAFMINMAFIMAASLPYLIGVVFFKNGGPLGSFSATRDSEFFIWTNKYLYGPLSTFWDANQQVFTLIFVFSMGYFLGKTYKESGVITAAASLVVFFIFEPFKDGQYTRVSGLLLSIPISIFVPLLYHKMMGFKKLQIKMPPQVPPIVSKAFASAFALAITAIPFALISQGFSWIAEGANWKYTSYSLKDGHMIAQTKNFTTLFKGLEVVLREPFRRLSINIGTGTIIYFFIAFFWFFGVHGSNVMRPITQAMYTPLILENAVYWNKYESLSGPKNYWTTEIDVNGNIMKGLHEIPLNSFAYIGGTGATLSLIILTLMFVRYKVQRDVAKIAIIPGCFGINEPVNFGYPIILNVVYGIPYILGFTIHQAVGHMWVLLHFMRPQILFPPTLPYGINLFFATAFDWRAIVLSWSQLIFSAFIWLPFLKPGVKAAMKINNEEYKGDEVQWKIVRPKSKQKTE